jgi:PKD repeat protein
MEVEEVKKVFIGAIIVTLLLTMTVAGCAGTTAPEAGFGASPTSGEAPLVVHFTDQSTGEITDWAWDFGDGSTSTSKNASHTYRIAGTYTVSLEVTGPDGSDTESKTDYITVTTPPAPEADFSAAPRSGEVPLAVQFTDESIGSITSWDWDFGDGSTNTSKNPSHTYQAAGIYTVSLEVTGPAGSDTEIKTGYVIVGEPEVITAEFSATPTSGNGPLEVQFTDQSTGENTSWDWDFGDGATSNEQNPSHAYVAAGTYTVSLEVTGSSGSDTVFKTAYITVTATPASPGWIYEVSYTEPDILLEARGYPDPMVTTCQVMLAETEVMPQDMAPAASVVPVPQVLSSRLEYDYDYGGEAPVRFHGGMTSTSVLRQVWLSSDEGVEVYSRYQSLALPITHS